MVSWVAVSSVGSHQEVMQTMRAMGVAMTFPALFGPMWLEQGSFLLIPKAHMKADASPYPTTGLLRFQTLSPVSPPTGQRPSQQEGTGAADKGVLRVCLAVWGKQRTNWKIKNEEISAVGKYTGKCTLC